ATELFGVPVKIGSARLWVLTGPQWMIDDVAIGTDADTVKIARAKLGRSSLGTTRFDSIQLEGAQLPPAMALKLITGASGGTLLAAGDVRVTGLVFAGSQGMPPLDLQARFEGGRLTAIAGQGEDTESGKVILDMKREQQWQLNFSAAQVRWIIGPGLPLTDVTLKAEMSPGNLQVKEFAATLHGGGIGGSGNVSWQEGWRVGARLEAKLLDANKIAPAWAAEGRASGSAALAAEAASARELLARARISGSFEIGRGLLAGMDVERVVQNSGLGEQTRFESLRGDFFSDARGIELTGLQLVAGSVKANGALTLAPDNSASGRVAIEMQSPAARRAANLRIGGTLAAPRYLR
ncbi:MAG: hypothetical protein Q8J99_00810, partial [Sulfuritalea sp.]|nr:hypothetical protein [Sulfuritalea sp.]